MKKPDEIKKGLSAHVELHECLVCPYRSKKERNGLCIESLLADALAFIQQLEAQNAEKDETIQQLESGLLAQADVIATMGDRIQQLEAERDAALVDFKLYRERNIKGECGVYACDLCKVGGKYEEWEELKCPKGCMGIEHWQWRGVQKEDSDA